MRACRRAWPSAWPSAGEGALKILILKPSSLGDIVQTLPVLRCLKLHLPDSAVYWWVETALAPLLEGDPDLSGLVHFDRRRWARPANWLEIWRSVQWIRAQGFDWVIDLQCLARSGAFAWLANGQRLVGLDERREGARGFYDLAARRASWHTHAVDWYLEVLPLLKVPVRRDFEWIPVRKAASDSIRRQWSPDSARWVAVQPGARWANKRWPAAHFAETVRQLAATEPGLRFAILGGKDEQTLGGEVAQAAPDRCLDLTGRISLPEMIEWIRLCQAMLTNDTGPMHVAAALGTPVIGLFGPTEPARTGPYAQQSNVLRTSLPCVPCMRPTCHHDPSMECLKKIQPGTAVSALRRVLEKTSRR